MYMWYVPLHRAPDHSWEYCLAGKNCLAFCAYQSKVMPPRLCQFAHERPDDDSSVSTERTYLKDASGE